MSNFGLPTTLKPAASTIKKAKKRIPRPSNCFIAYRMAAHRTILEQRPNINSKEVSQIVGKMWKNEPEHVKNHFRAIASQMKKDHANRYPDYSYNPKRRTNEFSGTSSELKNDSPCETSTRSIRYLKDRSCRKADSRYSQISSQTTLSQSTSSQTTSEYGDMEEMDIGSQCAVVNSTLACDIKWETIGDQADPDDNYSQDIHGHSYAMNAVQNQEGDEAVDFSASSSSSQVQLQEYFSSYEILDLDCGAHLDINMLPTSTRWWHVSAGDPMQVSGYVPLPADTVTDRGLPFILSPENFSCGSF
ncbi:hypothetical protein BGW37DRAFT_523329 [Umbelopsis sp. PMI_123]|nr:hypothetical protein BGW37DRAFT_523329 [Umbelopsis sp. PMI_123]